MKRNLLFVMSLFAVLALTMSSCKKDAEEDPEKGFDGKIIVLNNTGRDMYVQFNKLPNDGDGDSKWDNKETLSDEILVKPGKSTVFYYMATEFSKPNRAADRQGYPAICTSFDGDVWNMWGYYKMELLGAETTINVSLSAAGKREQTVISRKPFKAIDKTHKSISTKNVDFINNTTDTIYAAFIGWNHTGIQADEYPYKNLRAFSSIIEVKPGETKQLAYYENDYAMDSYTPGAVVFNDNDWIYWHWNIAEKEPNKFTIRVKEDKPEEIAGTMNYSNK